MSKKHNGGTTAGGKGKGAIITVAVIILALILTLVAAIGSYGFTQKDVKKWFNNWGHNTQLPDDGGVVDGDGNQLDLNKINPMPSAITFIEPTTTQALYAKSVTSRTSINTQSITFRAILKPENVDVKLVTWELNDNSSNHALSLTVSEENSLVATLTCEGTLDVQSNLICRSVENPEISATCTIDYLVPFRNLELQRSIDNWDKYAVAGFDCETSIPLYNYTSISPNSGTVMGTTEVTFYYELTQEFKTAMENQIGKDLCFGEIVPNYEVGQTSYNALTPYSPNDFNDSDISEKEFISAFKTISYLNPQINQAVLIVNVSYVYNGKIYGTTTDTQLYLLDVDDMPAGVGTPITGIEIAPGDTVIGS